MSPWAAFGGCCFNNGTLEFVELEMKARGFLDADVKAVLNGRANEVIDLARTNLLR